MSDPTTAAMASHQPHSRQKVSDAKSPSPPSRRCHPLDVILLATTLLLLVFAASHLLRTTRLETNRLANILTDASVMPISRRARPAAVGVRQDAQPAAASPPVVLVQQQQQQQSVGNESESSARHLLSTDTPSYAPFESESSKKKYYEQWEKEFQALSDRHRHAGRAFVEYLSPAVDKLSVYAAPLDQTEYCISAFDGRRDPALIFVLKHTFHMLTGMGNGGPGKADRPKWGMVLFVPPEHEGWFAQELKIGVGLPGEHIKLVRTSPIVKQQANSLAASRHYYESIPCEHIVYLQPDALMLRSEALPGAIHTGPDLYELMHKYIYLGAPWPWCTDPWCMVGGNGGASFRRRSIMMDLTRHIGCTEWECNWVDDFPAMQHHPDGWRHVRHEPTRWDGMR